MNQYASRSLVIYKVLINQRGEPDNFFDVNDINGRTLITLFDMFCKKYKNELITSRGSSKHILLGEHEAKTNSLLLKMRSGSSGEHVDVISVETAKKSYEYDWDKASMVSSRYYMSIGHSANYGLLCIEHTSKAAGDTALFTPFREFMKEEENDAVVNFEPLIEKEVLDRFISVENVVIKKYLEANDIADSLVREGDCVTVSLTHKRGNPFNKGILDTLINNRGKAATLFGLSGDLFSSEKSEITVELKDSGGKKAKYKFGIGVDSKFREILNDGGDPALSDEAFVAKCDERCSIVAERLGRAITVNE